MSLVIVDFIGAVVNDMKVAVFRRFALMTSSRNFSIILLYNEFWRDSPYLKVLQRISQPS